MDDPNEWLRSYELDPEGDLELQIESKILSITKQFADRSINLSVLL